MAQRDFPAISSLPLLSFFFWWQEKVAIGDEEQENFWYDTLIASQWRRDWCQNSAQPVDPAELASVGDCYVRLYDSKSWYRASSRRIGCNRSVLQ